MKVKISLVVVFATLMAATYAFGDGFNLVSWPLLVANTAIQPVMADSMGAGVQVAGGATALASDQVKYFDTNTSTWFMAWYKTGAGKGWKGTLTTIEPDKGYWIIIRGAHPAVTLTMTGSVNTAARTIPIKAGPSENYVGTLFAIERLLGGASPGDSCGLIASGFDGAATQLNSSLIRYFDGSTWYTTWYKTGSGAGWKGTLGPGQTTHHPKFQPGNGYVIQLRSGHAFISNQWNYKWPPAKGEGALVSQTRAQVQREISQKHARALSPSTNKSLAREQAVEQKKSR